MQYLGALSLLLFLDYLPPVRAQSCYYPDGSLALNDTPCKTDGGVTVCCGFGFACLENGVCQVTSLALANNPDQNAAIEYFRGSCTDQTFVSDQCPQFCIGTQYANAGGNSMEYCSSDTFCCYGGTCDCSTGFNTTIFDASAVAYTTIGVPNSGVTSTSSSSSSSSSTVESSTATSSAVVTDASTSSGASTTGSAAAATETNSAPTSSSSDSGLSTGAKAGIGVGVAIGALLLAGIGFLFWRNRRQHKELEGLKAQREPLQPDMYQGSHQHQPMMSGPSELSGHSAAPAWSLPGPDNGYYNGGKYSNSTPSNPSELRG